MSLSIVDLLTSSFCLAISAAASLPSSPVGSVVCTASNRTCYPATLGAVEVCLRATLEDVTIIVITHFQADPSFICSLPAELIRVFFSFQMFDFSPPTQPTLFFYFSISNLIPLWLENKV